MSFRLDPVELTQKLVRFDSQNPPGREEEVCRFVGEILAGLGLVVRYHELAPGRLSLVATLAGAGDRPPLCLTGHVDTVPFDRSSWSFDPLAGDIVAGRLRGRGSSDMKSGVAALVAAAAELAARPGRGAELVLILTAGEEDGCQGALALAREGALPRGGLLLVAEPTANQPWLGHKGALWLEVTFPGKAAHGSMPHEGDNAIYKAARAALRLENLFAETAGHPHMGRPTVNVGVMQGGAKINIVPERASLQVDIRSVPGLAHAAAVDLVQAAVGPEARVQVLVDTPGFATDPHDPALRRLWELVSGAAAPPTAPGYASYFTDGAALREAMGRAPTVILGPGEPHQAHQTDEYCLVERIGQATELYTALAASWLGL